MNLFDFSGIKKMMGDAGALLRSKRAELEGLRRQRDILAAAPLSRADTVRAMHRRIDEEGARHMAVLSEAVRQMAVARDPDRLITPILSAVKPNYAPTPLSMEAGMCLAFADHMKAAASRIVEAMTWPEGAMEHATKEKRLSELDKNIGAIEADLTTLVHQSRAAGISL